jgi:hypothetical protein
VKPKQARLKNYVLFDLRFYFPGDDEGEGKGAGHLELQMQLDPKNK